MPAQYVPHASTVHVTYHVPAQYMPLAMCQHSTCHLPRASTVRTTCQHSTCHLPHASTVHATYHVPAQCVPLTTCQHSGYHLPRASTVHATYHVPAVATLTSLNNFSHLALVGVVPLRTTSGVMENYGLFCAFYWIIVSFKLRFTVLSIYVCVYVNVCTVYVCPCMYVFGCVFICVYVYYVCVYICGYISVYVYIERDQCLHSGSFPNNLRWSDSLQTSSNLIYTDTPL